MQHITCVLRAYVLLLKSNHEDTTVSGYTHCSDRWTTVSLSNSKSQAQPSAEYGFLSSLLLFLPSPPSASRAPLTAVVTVLAVCDRLVESNETPGDRGVHGATVSVALRSIDVHYYRLDRPCSSPSVLKPQV